MSPELTRNCPACGQPMQRARSRYGDRRVNLICSTWPTCRFSEPLPPYFVMRQAEGAIPLPLEEQEESV